MTYLKELPMQTHQMQEKQTLRVKDSIDNEIVSIVDSPCVYIDDDFYTDKFKEDKYKPGYKSLPVNI